MHFRLKLDESAIFPRYSQISPRIVKARMPRPRITRAVLTMNVFLISADRDNEYTSDTDPDSSSVASDSSTSSSCRFQSLSFCLLFQKASPFYNLRFCFIWEVLDNLCISFTLLFNLNPNFHIHGLKRHTLRNYIYRLFLDAILN